MPKFFRKSLCTIVMLLVLVQSSFALNTVELSVEYIANPAIGRALSLADIYVGIIDLDPKIVGNQKQISVLQENGTTVQVAQPISTSAGGVPLYNGSPVTIMVEGSYSLRIDDSTGSQAYYVPKNSELESINSFDNIADMEAIVDTPTDGDVFTVLGYNSAGDGGGGQFRWDSASVLASDSITIFKATAITTGRWIRLYSGPVLAVWGGVIADAVTDDSTAMQNVIDNFRWISLPEGQILLATGLTIAGENFVMYGAGKQRTQFVATSAVTGDIISWNVGTDTRFARGHLSDFSIRGARSGAGNWEDYTYTAQIGLHIENIINGLRLDDINVERTNAAGIQLAGCFSASLSDCFVEICKGNAYSMIPSVGASSSGDHNLEMSACRGYQTNQSYFISSAYGVSISGGGAEDCLTNGFNFADCRGISVEGTWIEDMDLRATGSYAGFVWNGSYGTIDGSFFNGADSANISVVGAVSKLVVSGCHDNGLVTVAINNPDGAEVWDFGNEWSVPNSGITYNEEGTWTPVLEGLTTPGVNTYLAQEGTYKRNGNRISFSGYIRLNAKGAMAGDVVIEGLPYPGSSTATEQAVTFSKWSWITIDTAGGYYSLSGSIPTSSSEILLIELPSTGTTSPVAIDSTDISNSNNVILTFSGDYEI